MGSTGRRIRRWGVRLALIAALVVVWNVDGRLKTSSKAGFVPSDAKWVAYAPEFGWFWSGVIRRPMFREYMRHWPMSYYNSLLYVRGATGIRPTPIRWNTWLGSKGLVFGGEKGVGLCVRPGVLLRGAHCVNSWVTSPVAPGVYRYRTLFYAWRDGFVVVSTTQDVVAQAVAGNEFVCDQPLKFDDAYVTWKGSPEAFVIIRAEEGLPVRGGVTVSAAGNAAPPTAWPDDPMLAVDSVHAEPVALVARGLQAVYGELPEWTGLKSGLPEFEPWKVLAEKTAPLEQFGIAAYGSSSQESTPPRVGYRFRLGSDVPGGGAHFAEAAQGGGVVRGGCVGRDCYVASDDALLALLTGAASAGQAGSATTAMRLDWERVGRTMQGYLLGLLEDDDSLREAIELDAIPATEAMMSLGQLSIEGQTKEGRMVFGGKLAVAPPSRLGAEKDVEGKQ